MSETVIRVEGLFKSFGPTPVLEDVSLTTETNELQGIIGPNGGGKTVLLKLLLGLEKPDRGSIEVLGKLPGQARGEVGYVPQYAGFDSDFPIDVRGAVLTGRQSGKKLFRRFGREDREMADEALGKVSMLELATRPIGHLSGGQLQRVLIARALVTRPSILMLDEPTANLDPQGGQTIYELLAKLKEEMTVLLVSHDVGVISRYVSSVACVNRKLFQHAGSEPPRYIVEQTYNCPVHFIPPRHNDPGHVCCHGEEGCDEESC